MFEREVVIDGRGHLLGRLASVVAKQLLGGQKIVVVRCEQIVITGSLIRNKMKWARFLKKKMNTNPKRGPFHYRSPARMFWRTVRGMLPHKSYRGQQALARLQCYEGVPTSDPNSAAEFGFDKKKRMVVPDALKVLHVKPIRKTTLLGVLASESGWKHGELIKKLESQRIVKAQEFYMAKKAQKTLKAKAEAAADLSSVNPVLKELGYYIEPTPVGAMKAILASGAEEEAAPMEEAKEEPAAAPAAAGGDY